VILLHRVFPLCWVLGAVCPAVDFDQQERGDDQDQGGIGSPAAGRRLAEALALYEGDFLAGFFLSEAAGFETWASAERERLHRLAVDALGRLGCWQLERGDYSSAVATASPCSSSVCTPLVRIRARQRRPLTWSANVQPIMPSPAWAMESKEFPCAMAWK
jgi:hypothetical protein